MLRKVGRVRSALPGAAWRLGLVSAAALCVAIAAIQLPAVARWSSAEAALSLIRSLGKAPEPAAVRDFVNSSGLADGSASCSADTLVLVAEFWRELARLRGAEAVTGEASFEADLREANALQQVSCNPTDGLAWADAADVRRAREGWSESILRHLAMSQKYTPFEGDALALRIDVLSAHLRSLNLEPGADATQREAEAMLSRDLDVTLAYAGPEAVTAAIAALPEAWLAEARAMAERLPDTRGQIVKAALEARAKAVAP